MKMPRPDWSRYAERVQSRAHDGTGRSFTPLGDPKMWGGHADVELVSIGVAAVIRESGQFLRVQCSDVYARMWSINGTVAADTDVWNTGNPNLPLPTLWNLALIIQQGSGNVQIEQWYDLRKLTELAVNTGYQIQPGFATNVDQVRAFSIIGGVVGNNWSARIFALTAPAAGFVTPFPVRVTAIATPLAAGTGL